MKLTVDIEEDDPETMIIALEHISKMISKGFNSGYYPFWILENTEED